MVFAEIYEPKFTKTQEQNETEEVLVSVELGSITCIPEFHTN